MHLCFDIFLVMLFGASPVGRVALVFLAHHIVSFKNVKLFTVLSTWFSIAWRVDIHKSLPYSYYTDRLHVRSLINAILT